MSFISYALHGNYKRYFNNLKKISQKENISYTYLKFDTIRSVLKYGIGLSDYLNYKFYIRNKEERKQYVGIKLQDKFYEKVSPSAYKNTYAIKPIFLKEFKKYTKREFVYPKEDNLKKLEKFLSSNECFMQKPANGLGGGGVKKVYKNTIKDIEEYYNYLKQNNCFVEQLVIQNKVMSKLCKESINTIRIMTFNDHGTPLIIWAGLRVGNGINPVDNFHAGGMGCSIDLKTGKIYSNAIDKDLNEFEKHPKSGLKFIGFKIPYFEEAKELVKKACLENDKIKLVGWDVAISEEGPVIIEGNRRPGFDLIQVLSDRGRMDIVEDALSRLD